MFSQLRSNKTDMKRSSSCVVMSGQHREDWGPASYETKHLSLIFSDVCTNHVLDILQVD